MGIRENLKAKLIFEIFLFFFGIALISLFFQNNLLLMFLLLFLWLILLKFWYIRHDIHFFVLGAILGPLGEIICIYFGAWQYANPSLLGIPIWLPLAWGLFVMLIKRITETILKWKIK